MISMNKIKCRDLIEASNEGYEKLYKQIRLSEVIKVSWIFLIIMGIIYISAKNENQATKIFFWLASFSIVGLFDMQIKSIVDQKIEIIKMHDFVKTEMTNGTLFKIKERVYDIVPGVERYYYEIEGDIPEKLNGVPHVDFRGIRLFSKQHLERDSEVVIFDQKVVEDYELDQFTRPFLYFSPSKWLVHKDAFEIAQLKEEWINSPYTWTLELTDGFERYQDELKAFRLEYENQMKGTE